jgi:hypothetical protein
MERALAGNLIAALIVVAGCGDSSAGASSTGSGGSSAGAGGEAAAGGGSGVGGSADGGASSASASASASASSQQSSGSGGSVASCLQGLSAIPLLAVSVQLAPRKPVYFEVEATDAGGVIQLALTPLGTPYRQGTDVMIAVGEPIIVTSDPLGEGGALRITTGEIQVPGAANPFSPNDITASLVLIGVCDPANDDVPMCGSVQGSLTAPIVLELEPDQNSFAVNSDLQAVVDCAGTEADPIF